MDNILFVLFLLKKDVGILEKKEIRNYKALTTVLLIVLMNFIKNIEKQSIGV